MDRRNATKGARKPAGTRSPGRPSSDAALRERMLEIALREFSAHGFRGVSMTTIAKGAGATPAMVHYYFGTKKGLYEAVLQHALGPILARLQAASEPPQAGADQLPSFVHGYMSLLANNPLVPLLIVRDVLSPGGEMRDTFVQGFAGRGARGVRDLVRHAQALGTLRADLDPDYAALSLLSMAVFPFVGHPVAGQVLNYSIDPDRIAELAEHTLQLFYNGAGA
jgi:TetR/AcrR family transcriptional regulator